MCRKIVLWYENRFFDIWIVGYFDGCCESENLNYRGHFFDLSLLGT